MECKLCSYCNKPLVSTGKNRKNGKKYDHWDKKPRKMHKKCMIIRRQKQEREEMRVSDEEMQRLKKVHAEFIESMINFEINGDPLNRQN